MVNTFKTRLASGMTAKPFEVQDLDGHTRRLEDYQGKKLLLSFYRYAGCPLCNMRTLELKKHADEFAEAGLEVLAFFQSPEKTMRKWMDKRQSPFPTVADPNHEVYELYGVEKRTDAMMRMSVNVNIMKAAFKGLFPGRPQGPMSTVPADFLIGPDLRIHEAYYGEAISDHMPMYSIRSFMAA